MQNLSRSWVVWGLVAVVGVGTAWYFLWPGGDPALRPYVQSRPPYPVVFTSRSEAASFVPAAPEGEGFVYPGQRPWTAREGRLRVLKPSGEVHELTWGKKLPDGGTLIDVMSPSVTLDGTEILFAGRRGGEDPGHFRLYAVGVDGWNLRPLTGGPNDPGAVALPPMRYADESRTRTLPDAERRRIDYDDIDPSDAGGRRILFISSRQPDLGRGHARRATNLWEWDLGTDKRRQLSGNRNNDRWPVFLCSGTILFSLWSRNTEVVAPDRTEIRPLRPGEEGFTAPTDTWFAASVDQALSPRLANLVKVPHPVWRPRPLFHNRIVFMTAPLPGTTTFTSPAELAQLYLLQAPPALIANAPSGSPAGVPLPDRRSELHTGPRKDAAGRPLALATPSACPPDQVLFSGAAYTEGEAGPTPESFGLYLVGHDWSEPNRLPVPRLLFDDPHFVDAEPVAVYPRRAPVRSADQTVHIQRQRLELVSGRVYEGEVGQFRAVNIHTNFVDEVPGQVTDLGEKPAFAAAPEGTITEIRIWASHRDRFDDPTLPRIVGDWEPLARFPVNPTNDRAEGWLPLGSPTVLAGFDKEGKVATWKTAARDRHGRQARLVALAGDHYSGVVAGGFHFCTGCHAGHSALLFDEHAEILGP